jgi:hypothetical protein
MTESRTYITEDLWFPCDTCGKQITHHTVHTCFVMNPDILPTLEEWRLICKMVKQQCELADEEILDTARTMPVIDGATMEQAYVLFARAILKKAKSK